LNHYTNADFWECYRQLPAKIQKLADKNFKLLKRNPRHPSLRLKRVGAYWSARVTDDFRALGSPEDDGILWFWIGSHKEYEKLI